MAAWLLCGSFLMGVLRPSIDDAPVSAGIASTRHGSRVLGGHAIVACDLLERLRLALEAMRCIADGYYGFVSPGEASRTAQFNVIRREADEPTHAG